MRRSKPSKPAPGLWYVLRAAPYMSFIGQCPFNGGSDWVWVSTHASEKEARGVASLEALSIAIEHHVANETSYTGEIALLRFKGQLVPKDWSVNARD